MKLVHKCIHCNSKIFEVKNEMCALTNCGKHVWRVCEDKMEEKPVREKTVIYA